MTWFGHTTEELCYLIYNLKMGSRYRICGTREMIYGNHANYCSDCDFNDGGGYCYRYIKEILT